MTDHAVSLLRRRLEEFSPNDEQGQIALLEYAILKGWQTVYRIKEEDDRKEPVRSQTVVFDEETMRLTKEAFGDA